MEEKNKGEFKNIGMSAKDEARLRKRAWARLKNLISKAEAKAAAE